MKFNNSKSKEFTLVELIVVIAIIGILSAILIPSVTGYLTKAKKSNDIQMASEMTKEIQWYCIDNNINQNNLYGTDIKTMMLLRGYDLVPSNSGWTYVYNINKKKVEVKDFTKGGKVVVSSIPSNPIDPTNIENGYYIIGKGKSQVEYIVNRLSNLSSVNEYLSLLNDSKLADYIDFISVFNPVNTLYISNTSVMTKAVNVSKIVSSDKTVHIPEISQSITFESTLKLPETIRSVDKSWEGKSIALGMNIVDIGTVNIIPLSFEDDKPNFELGDNFNNSVLQSISVEYVDVSLKRDGNNHIVGVVAKTGQELSSYDDSNYQVNLFRLQDDYNSNIVESVTVVLTQRIIVSYFNEKSLFAYGVLNSITEETTCSLPVYMTLVSMIKS